MTCSDHGSYLFQVNSSDMVYNEADNVTELQYTGLVYPDEAGLDPNGTTYREVHAGGGWEGGSSEYETLSTLTLQWYQSVERILLTRVTVGICAFGVVGNLLTLLVLTRRRWQHLHRRSKLNEKRAAESDIIGLISLSVSDTLFCMSVLPHAVTDINQFAYTSMSFDLFFSVYEFALINTLVMSSTLITVAVTMNRYLNLCHPMIALRVSRPRVMKCVIIGVVVLSLLLNTPRYLQTKIESICHDGDVMYFPFDGPLKLFPSAESVYLWLYFVFGIVAPLLALAVCNCRIIMAVHQSLSTERRTAVPGRHIITRTLIVLVVLYIVLVAPSEVITFFRDVAINNTATHLAPFNLAVTIANTLQAVNFAFNFAPYLVLDKHFRRTVRELFCCPLTKNVILRFESVSSSSGQHAAQGAARSVVTSSGSHIKIYNNKRGSKCKWGDLQMPRMRAQNGDRLPASV